MSEKKSNFIEKYFYGKYTFLLFSIILTLIILPLMGTMLANITYHIFILFILAGCIYSISRDKKYFLFSMILVCLSFLGTLALILFPDNLTAGYLILFQPVFLVYTIFIILGHIIKSYEVNFDLIMGSICVYLMFGLTFGLIYLFIFNLNPAAFNLEQDSFRHYDILYFSFVTITTLGYGDVTPTIPLTKSLSILEAILGQFYIAIMVARLVALQLRKGSLH